MDKRRGSGIFLVLVSLVLLGYRAGMVVTGAVIGGEDSWISWINVVALTFLIVGLGLILTKAETRKITSAIEEMVKDGMTKKNVDSIQVKILGNYGTKRQKELRKPIYEEIHQIRMRLEKDQTVVGGGHYNVHKYTAPARLYLPRRTKIITADANELNGIHHQNGRGTFRYVFDENGKVLLGIASHPGGDPTQLQWEVRFDN
jgi:hypothetical protein